MNESKPTEPTTAVAVVQPTATALSWLPHRDAMLATSIDRTTPAGRVTLFNALQGDAMALGELIGEVVAVQDLVIHPAVARDEDTGGMRSYLRTVAVGPDGELYQCGSDGIMEAFGRMSAVFGPPPWKPPMQVKVRQVSRGARRWYTLELQPDSIR